LLPAIIAVLASLASLGPAGAATPPAPQEHTVEPDATCDASTSFEARGYVVRSVRVDSPFRFLPWIDAGLADLEREMAAMVGHQYQRAEILRWAAELERRNFLPDAGGSRVRASAVVVRVANCADGALDVLYYDFSTQIAPQLDTTIESRRAATSAPERVAGTVPRSPFRLAPSGGYDRDEGPFGGGRFEYRPAANDGPDLVDSLAIDGHGSPFMHRVSAMLSGSSGAEMPDWLAEAQWQFDYDDVSEPADDFQLERRHGGGGFSATTSPVVGLGVPLRFGGLIEGGKQSSDFATAILPSDTVSSSTYWSSKLYVGSSARLERGSFSLSYGLEVGSRGSADVDWIKHIVDLAHEISIPILNHRALSLESHVTGGLLDVPGTVPVSVRFFGGNREDPFIPGDGWAIRSNPVIRSIPANGFFRTKHGPGGTWFAAYNLTIAFPVWRSPLVPPELSEDPEFTDQVSANIASATSILQTEYRAKDASFIHTASRLQDAERALTDLAAAVEAAQASNPSADTLFKACLKAINTAQRRARKAAESKGGAQLGLVSDLLDMDEEDSDAKDGGGIENRASKVQLACVMGLNATVHDPAIASRTADFEVIRRDMERNFAAIDDAVASRQAESEMSYAKRIVDQLITECNIAAISPVLMFDVAHIGPSSDRYGTRYGVGGGLRLTLVDSVDFTVGYVANPTARSNEDPGAPFFTIQFRDVFR
jgi:hypothetical protein